MTYKVHVTKAIWADEECTDLFDDLYYDLELPFVLASAGLACHRLLYYSVGYQNPGCGQPRGTIGLRYLRGFASRQA
jgi:hypothetical protein